MSIIDKYDAMADRYSVVDYADAAPLLVSASRPG